MEKSWIRFDQFLRMSSGGCESIRVRVVRGQLVGWGAQIYELITALFPFFSNFGILGGMSNNNAACYSNWVEVDLGAIKENVRRIQEITSAQVMAVVKANAYGHGILAVARAAAEAGATWCGVARLEEAQELRAGGVQANILLLGFIPAHRIEEAVAAGVSLTVWNCDQVWEAAAAGERLAKPARLHLKVDTGMSRLGVETESALALAHQIANTPGVVLEGIYTHFARADEDDPEPTDEQERQFRKVLDDLDRADILPELVHAANSAALLTRPSTYFNLVRAGIAMYGLSPSPNAALPPGFRPALTWKAILSQVKTLPAGRGISYGHEYVTQGWERIGTVPVGYGDGYPRVRNHQVLVGGKRAAVTGRVCMDQIMIQLDGDKEIGVGDEVVLLGPQGDDCITPEELAERWDTVNYVVLCAIGPRVPRIYR